MSTLRSIKCDFPNCQNDLTENNFGDGWPGWGRVQGKIDDETGSTDYDLCPEHLNKVFKFLEGNK